MIRGEAPPPAFRRGTAYERVRLTPDPFPFSRVENPGVPRVRFLLREGLKGYTQGSA